MVLLKKFLIAFAVSLYSVAPVFAGDSDRVRGHWQGQGPKMLNLKADQQTAWAQMKKVHLEGMWASVQDLRLTKKRLRIVFQSSAGEEGLISHYKREYQIAVGRSLTRHHRLLVGVPSHRFRRSQSKGSGMCWDKGSGKNWGQSHGKYSNKRHAMGGDKGFGKGWGKGYGKYSNKRHAMGGDKGAGKRGDQSRGDKWQQNRKKKSFDSD